jgi:GH25 family lysozyme M1 (1,4-beta-N-acetylmuramidase)
MPKDELALDERVDYPDLSYYCGDFDWVEMVNSGVLGICTRASWGITEDSKHQEYRRRAKEMNLPCQPYHYLDWRWKVRDNAYTFCRVITTGATQTKLFPVCDLEMDPVPHAYLGAAINNTSDIMLSTRKIIGLPTKPLAYSRPEGYYSMSKNEVFDGLMQFLDIVKTETGEFAKVYSGKFYIVQWIKADPVLLNHDFWLAWWAAERYIETPPPWNTVGWTDWQYTGTGGVNWRADKNKSRYKPPEYLQKYYAYATPTPVPTPIPIPVPTPSPFPDHAHVWVCQICGAPGPVDTPAPIDRWRVTVQYARVNVRLEPDSNAIWVRFAVKDEDIYLKTPKTTNGYYQLYDGTYIFAAYVSMPQKV